jgi:hypothetical protein
MTGSLPQTSDRNASYAWHTLRAAMKLGNDLSDADPQSHADEEPGDEKPFVNGEL